MQLTLIISQKEAIDHCTNYSASRVIAFAWEEVAHEC